jgi:glycosyltransferase involved in cell wall biosynthesis
VGERPARATPVLVMSNHAHVVGGGELSLMDFLRGVDRDQWAPRLIVPDEGPMAARGRELGLPVHVVPLPTPRRPGPAVVASVATLGRLARRTDAALIHANGSRAMVYGGLAGRLAGRPAIWHVRIAESDGAVDRVLCALATTVIATSRAVARRFAWTTPHKITVVPNGVDLGRFAPRPPSTTLRAAMGVPPSSPLVVSIGRFVPEKGYRHLLDAAARIERTRPGVHWMLVGGGELEDELVAQARRLGLGTQVHFLGWREDVADLLALGDLFVLPSEREGFGRVLVEAMAMGKAVVATTAGGIPEIVLDGDTGLLVPPAAPTSLAEAVGALLGDPGRAVRLGAAGRARALATFSLDAHADGVARVYADVLGETRRRRERVPVVGRRR